MDRELAFVEGLQDPYEKPIVPPDEHPLVWDLNAVLKGRPSDVRHACIFGAASSPRLYPRLPCQTSMPLPPKFSQGKDPESLSVKELTDNFSRNHERRMAHKVLWS